MKTTEIIKNNHRKAKATKIRSADRFESDSLRIAERIATFAHQGQLRENGAPYLTHPFHCLDLYRRFVGIATGDNSDKDLMRAHGVYFDGVQEVCILHDVLEDTDVTMEEIAQAFSETGLKTFFDSFIKEPLALITHDKSVPYEDYIGIVMKNPVSAMVKMMDMTDNVNLLGLGGLDDAKLSRAKRYLDYIRIINDRYHFIENAFQYNLDLKKTQENQREKTLVK